MNNSWKKTTALLALISVTSLSGCADSGSIMTIEGVEIRNGVYLQKELGVCSDARTKASEQREEAGDTSEITDLFAETIDGKSASEWIKEQTLEKIKYFAAIEKLCEENGIVLSDEEKASINSDINSLWNDDNYYAQYFYGTDTIGEYYESIGVGRESLTQVYVNDDLSNKLFLHYFDADGVTPVSEDELNAYLKENYAAVKVLELDFVDYAGIELEDETDIQQVKDKAKAFADRLNSGESFAQIKYEIDLQQAQDDAKVDAIDSYGEISVEEGEELPDYDKYIEDAINEATAEKSESDDELLTVISKDSSSFDTAVTDYIWAASDNSSAAVFDTEDCVYIIVRDDITSKTDWLSENRSSVLKEIKGDEYDELIKAEYSGYTVEANDYLVNTKYAPDKIKGMD